MLKMIEPGMLVVFIVTKNDGYDWHPSWTPDYHLGVTEEKTETGKWKINSEKICYYISDGSIVPLFEIPAGQKDLPQLTILYANQGAIIDRLRAFWSC